MKAHLTLICCAFACLTACGAELMKPSDQLIATLIKIESVGKDNAIGDLNLKHRAYGPLQIRQPVCDDVNKRFGTHYRAEQCLGNRTLSLEIFRRYMDIYATPQKLGHQPTEEDFARIWNGGPQGYRLTSTQKYWEKVRRSGIREPVLELPESIPIPHAPSELAHQKKQPRKSASGSPAYRQAGMMAEIQ